MKKSSTLQRWSYTEPQPIVQLPLLETVIVIELHRIQIPKDSDRWFYPRGVNFPRRIFQI